MKRERKDSIDGWYFRRPTQREVGEWHSSNTCSCQDEEVHELKGMFQLESGSGHSL